MNALTKTIAMALISGFSGFAAPNAAQAQGALSGTFRSSPGDEVWNLVLTGVDGYGTQHYSFTYNGNLISGSGVLYLYSNGAVAAQTTSVSRDFLGHAIPVNQSAQGQMTGPRSFTLYGFQLDLQVRQLGFY